MQRFSSFLGRKRVRALVVAATALGLASSLLAGDPAQADPKQYTAAAGVGSDTTQDVMNALAGFSNNNTFLPAVSGTASGNLQLASWDAVGSACITTKAPGATFVRPNGSGAGRAALSRSIDGTNWIDFANACGGPKPIPASNLQFARSSSGPGACSGATCTLTFVPFGRDGVSFAYYAQGTATPVTHLSVAEIQQVLGTGPTVIDGQTVTGCLIQPNSGTHTFWRGALGLTQSAMEAATADCGGTLQENDGNALKARADSTPALANKVVIIGYSAANFIAQSNGVGPAQLPLPLGTVGIGEIESIGTPVSGSAPNLTPNATFYANTTFGRTVYNVLSKVVATGPGNAGIKALFGIGGATGICAPSMATRIESFGFSTSGVTCGSTTLEGPFQANPAA